MIFFNVALLHKYPENERILKGYFNQLLTALGSRVVIEHVVSRQLNKFEDVFKLSW
ncbi:hypothetical protein CLU82_1026 [Flavobacterium sp. 5]|nr:hypothetical protein CLU82_1026 [Flavobacterium sp. 5]